jgi:hypothetical protein
MKPWHLAVLAILGCVACVSTGLRMVHEIRTGRAETAAQAISKGLGAPMDCSLDGRMKAANLHYRVGCLLAALRICGDFEEPRKFTCYDRERVDCETFGDAYEDWLRMGARK